MDDKKWFFWVDGAGECDKIYFETESEFLDYLRYNDSCICGAVQMTSKEWDAASAEFAEF